MKLRGRAVGVALASAVLVTTFALPAAGVGNGSGSGDGDGGSSADAGMEGGTLTAEATDTQIVVTGDVGQDGEGNLTTSGDSDWTPPVCWYEPSMTPTEFESEVERLEREGGLGTLATNHWGTSGVFTDIYRDNNPEPWNAWT